MVSCSCCNLKVLFGVLIASVVFFIVALVLAFSVFPDVLHTEVNKAMRLEDNTDQYNRFLELPFPLDFKIYLFNVENPNEILSGAKPIVTEVGPYIYKQYRKKTVISTNAEEDTVSYTQTETFEFDVVASAPLTEDDAVTVLNAPLMSMYQLSDEFFMAGAVDHCIKSTFPPGYDQPFINTTVRHLLFEGINFCTNYGTDLCSLVNDVVCQIASTKKNIDTLADYSLQFSFLNYKRREPDGKYTVNRGMNDIANLGHIMAWNDMKYTDYWAEGTSCSQVKGTDSTVYPPRIDKDSKFYIFATDICRLVEINYIGDGTYKNIDGYMFGTNSKTLYSSKKTVTDDCYCSLMSKDADGHKSCFLDGVVDIQTCLGVPVLLSFPHFLWADEKYQNGVEGLNPNPDLHKIYLLVEPNTGTPLEGIKRVQLNTVVRPVTGVRSLIDIKRTVLPLLWIEEGVALTDKYVNQLQSDYFDKVNILEGVKWTLVAVSAVLVVVFGGLVIRQRFFKK